MAQTVSGPVGPVRGLDWCRSEGEPVPWRAMSIRIEIELTSSAPTVRGPGAPPGPGSRVASSTGRSSRRAPTVGDQLRVETEKDIDGIRVLSVVPGKEKAARTDVLELLPSEERFEPVVQQRAPRGGRDDGPRRPRRDRPGGDDRGDRRRERPDRGERPRWRRAVSRSGGRGGARPGDRDRRPRGDDRRRQRPHFTPPPEVPQRPKPKRLRPGKQHRTEVLESLPEEQRPVAELALQGIAAVRQRLREDNARLQAEGKPEMPEAAVLRMAEELIPRLRVADWLDRAEAAQRQLEHLDLRDLRSVVAAVRRSRRRPRRVDARPGHRAEGGARHQAGRGADPVARRRRGGARRRSGRAGAAPVVGAAEGRRAVPGGAGGPARRGDDGVAAADRRPGPVVGGARGGGVLAGALAGRAGRARRAAQRRAHGHRPPARRRCSPRSPRCSRSRSPPARRCPSRCARRPAAPTPRRPPPKPPRPPAPRPRAAPAGVGALLVAERGVGPAPEVADAPDAASAAPDRLPDARPRRSRRCPRSLRRLRPEASELLRSRPESEVPEVAERAAAEAVALDAALDAPRLPTRRGGAGRFPRLPTRLSPSRRVCGARRPSRRARGR